MTPSQFLRNHTYDKTRNSEVKHSNLLTYLLTYLYSKRKTAAATFAINTAIWKWKNTQLSIELHKKG